MKHLNRTRLWAVLSAFCALQVTSLVSAESPTITQMGVTQLQVMDAQAAVAAATNPVTGAIKLESEPMQCAITCEQRVSLERAACGGYLNASQRAEKGLEDPTPDCNLTRHTKYAACMAQCGFKVSPLVRMVRESDDRSTPMPAAIGSPEELAQHPRGR